MLKQLLLIFTGILVLGCDSTEVPNTENPEKESNEKADFDTRTKRWVESVLEIASTEEYELKIYQEQLNDDGFLDAIITVNRLAYAIDEAVNSVNTVHKVETGYLGKFNYVFHYDGQTDKFSKPIPIGSSAIVPLKVNFEHIQSPNFKTALVDYRIRDAAFRNYFFITDGLIHLALQHTVYTSFMSPDCKYYATQFIPSRTSAAKDIVVYQAKCTSKTPENSTDPFDPELIIQPELAFHFFYLPNTRKYAVLKANQN